jgi:predicted nucleic acid-binding protein
MIVHLLDTSILVDLIRGHSHVRNWIDQLDEGDRAISVVTEAELLAGCENARAQRIVERELESFTVVPITESISDVAIRWLRQHRLSSGTGYPDCLIGATALMLGATLCTVNVKHFRVFEGLRVERPY